MTPRGCAGGLAAFALVNTLVACNTGPTAPSATAGGGRLELTGPSTVAPGQVAQYRLHVISAGGSSREVSLGVEWRSSAEAILTIASPGGATARQPGEAVITASYDGRQATLTVVVVPAGTFSVKGTVKDRLTNQAVAGVRVQVVAGGSVTLETETGASGSYQLYGVAPDAELRVSKDGYFDSQHTLNIAAHSTIDMVIGRIGAPSVLEGAYTVTLEIGGECGMAAMAKTRKYSATIRPDGRRHLVTLSGAVYAQNCGTNLLAPGLGCNQFHLEQNGESITFGMIDGDWGDGGHIQEQLADGSWLFVAGWGSSRFVGTVLEASLTADTSHCPAPSANRLESCRLGFTYCRTDELRLRFTAAPQVARR